MLHHEGMTPAQAAPAPRLLHAKGGRAFAPLLPPARLLRRERQQLLILAEQRLHVLVSRGARLRVDQARQVCGLILGGLHYSRHRTVVRCKCGRREGGRHHDAGCMAG